MNGVRLALLSTIFAATISTSAMANPSFEEFDHTTSDKSPPWSDSFSLKSFDTTLGTLTGVTISLNADISAALSVSGLGGLLFSNVAATSTFTLSTPSGDDSRLVSTSGASGVSILGVDPLGTKTGSLLADFTISAADFDKYESVGGLPLTFTEGATAAIASGIGANLSFASASAEVGAITSITYYYTPASGGGAPIPEPSALGWMGVAFLGVGFARRRLAR